MSRYRQHYMPPRERRRLFGVDLTAARLILALMQGAGLAAAFIAVYFLLAAGMALSN